MKTIYLVRHGKSSWPGDERISDSDRPLKVKGIVQVQRTADKLKNRQCYPDLIVSSPANRTLHTALIIAKTLDYPANRITIKPDLYGSDHTGIEAVIKGLKDDYDHVMIFGHDPSLTNFANKLTKKSKEKIPTASVVAIELETNEWRAIDKSKGKQLFFLKSKME